MQSRLSRGGSGLWAVAMVALTTVLIVGCGGDSAKSTPTPLSGTIPASTSIPGGAPAGFDPNKLTAIVLRPEDVNLGGTALGTWAPDPSIGLAFNTLYGDDTLQVSSSVILITDLANRDALFTRTRKSVNVTVGGETSYDLPGADVAYRYVSTDLADSVVVAFKDDYIILITMLSRDKTMTDAATSYATIDRYAKAMFGRLQQLITNPESVVPMTGAQQFATPAPGTATVLAGLVPTATPTP